MCSNVNCSCRLLILANGRTVNIGRATGSEAVAERHARGVRACRKPFDASQVELLLPFDSWSVVGSNRHRQERTTQTPWRDFLQDLEG